MFQYLSTVMAGSVSRREWGGGGGGGGAELQLYGIMFRFTREFWFVRWNSLTAKSVLPRVLT